MSGIAVERDNQEGYRWLKVDVRILQETFAAIYRREVFFVFVLTAIAILVRTYLATLPHVVKGDETGYIWLGQSIATGNGFALMGMPELHLNPLFPMIIAAIYALTGILEESSTVAFVIFGSLLVIPVYLLARRIFGRPTAAIAGLLLAIHPALTVYMFYEAGLSEPIYAFTLFFGLYFLYIGIEDGRLWAYFAAGAMLGLSYMARAEGIQILPIAIALVMVSALFRRGLFRRSTITRLAVLVLAFSLFGVPYVFWLQQQTGKLMVSGKPWIAYMQNRLLAQGDLMTFDKLTWGLDRTGKEVIYFSQERFERSMFTEIADDPEEAISHLKNNVRRLGRLMSDSNLTPLFAWAFVALGLIASPWSRRRVQGESILLVAVLAALLPAMLMFPSVRFMSPIFPVLLIWIAVGIVTLQRWLLAIIRRSNRGSSLLQGSSVAAWYIVIGLVIAYFLATYTFVADKHQQELAKEFAGKKLGLTIRNELMPNSTMMSRDDGIALYAGQKWATIPNADFQNVMDYARSHNARYMVVDEWSFQATRPQLALLLDESAPPKGLKVLRTERTDIGKFIVYEFLGD